MTVRSAGKSRRGLSTREKRLIQAAALLTFLLLISVLLRDGEGEPAAQRLPASSAPVPQPAETGSASRGPAAAASAPSASVPADLSQLRLHGLLATGAVIGFANGGQRLIPIGREALPGLILVRVEQHHAVFRGSGGEIRLGFDGAVAGRPVTAAAAATAPAAGEAAQRDESLRYRLGLAPRMVGARVTGFTVRPNVDMPALASAGIRPGDVIVMVNGSNLDEERLQELAWTLANSGQVSFEVERGGRRIRLSLQPR